MRRANNFTPVKPYSLGTFSKEPSDILEYLIVGGPGKIPQI